MANEKVLQLGEDGVELQVETSYSGLATASTKEIRVQKPDGTLAQWTAGYSGTQLTYTPNTTEHDQNGVYKIHSYVVTAGGKILIGRATSYRVRALYLL